MRRRSVVNEKRRVNNPRGAETDGAVPPEGAGGHITANNFRDFTFAHAVQLWGTQNKHFFEGTCIAKEAATVLTAAQTPTLAAAE